MCTMQHHVPGSDVCNIDTLLPLLQQNEIAMIVNMHRSDNAPDLLAICRKRELVNLRKIYCILAQKAGYHLREIGRFLNGRDHTTIMHNIQMGKHHLEREPEFRSLFNQIQQNLLEHYHTKLMAKTG